MSMQGSALEDFFGAVEQGSNQRFDRTLAQQASISKAQLDNQYKIAKLQASTERERIAVDRWYKQEQVKLAKLTFEENIRQFNKTFGLQEGELLGWYNDKPTLERESIFADLMGEYQGKPTLEAQELGRRFGLDVATTAAEMRSRPDMLYAYRAFQEDLPALLGGNLTRGAVSGTPGGPGPQQQTIGSTLSELGYLSAAVPGGGAPAPGSTAADPTLQTLGNVYTQGFENLGAQTLEGFDENQLGFLKSAGGWYGQDYRAQLSRYLGSRLGQSVGGGG